MKIVLLGAPGSGKGTRAKYISELYKIPHISTGDLFRENMANNTSLGQKVKSIMATGGLCPDDITVEMVKDRLSKDDCKNGYLLDGFPRNIYQAECLDKISAPDRAINVEIEISKAVERITGRRVCEKCHNSFHTDFIGDLEVCPDCGGKLIRRKDDTPEIIKERMEVYEVQTAPLIDYYIKQNKIICISGESKIENIKEELLKALK